MEYLLLSIPLVVTLLGWLAMVRWDSRRYLSQRRIERRLQDYPRRPLTEAEANELTLLREIAEANPRPEFRAQLRERWMAGYTDGSQPADGPSTSGDRPAPLHGANPDIAPVPSGTAGTASDSSNCGTDGFDTRGRILTFGATRSSTPESPTPPTDTTSSGTAETAGTPGHANHEGLER